MVSKARKRMLQTAAILALLVWTGMGANDFAMKMQAARTYDAIVGIWADGPGRPGLTPDEVEEKILEYKIRAAYARGSAYDRLTINLMTPALVFMALRLIGTRRSSSS